MSAYGKLQLQVQSIQESMEQDLLELNRFKTVLDKDSNNLSIKADEAIKTLYIKWRYCEIKRRY